MSISLVPFLEAVRMREKQQIDLCRGEKILKIQEITEIFKDE